MEIETLDTSLEINTPERVTFEVLVCGPFARLAAALLDGVFISVLLGVILLVLSIVSLGSQSIFGLYLAILFVLEWGYKIFFEIVNKGQTPGKRALGLRVMSVDGGPMQPGQAVVRNLVRAFEGILPFAYIPALLSICCSKRFQRLGDLAAGTIVVWETPQFRMKELAPNQKSDRLLELLPARLELGGRMMKLLSNYLSRRMRLSSARLEEIATPVAAILRQKYNLPADAPADAVMVAVGERVREIPVRQEGRKQR
ncbi:MAG: RDD family protein [Isosphaeraceae bacterium]